MMDNPQTTFSGKKDAIELRFVPEKYLSQREAAFSAGPSPSPSTCFQNPGKE
jgi:hypothetical protein